jgi:hypothetical protein
MSTPPTQPMIDDAAKTKAAEEPEFPAISNDDYGSFHVDKKHGTFWIGLRLNSTDYAGALAFLDSMKFNLWQLYVQLARQKEAQQRLVAPAGAPKEGIAAMAKRLVGLGR